MERVEVLKVLKLVADGKISPEQGTDLLAEFVESDIEKKTTGRFNIEILNKDTGKVEANIRLPVKLANFVGNILREKEANFKIGSERIDVNIKELLDEVISTGEAVEIEADERRITIRIEE
jgi:hypothetical protein